jgi:FkbM family methyltransferase
MAFPPFPLTEPIWRDERFRIGMTTSCRDCDPIPKVPEAGQIVIENGRRVQVMHNGLRVSAGSYYGDWTAEVITLLRGHHEPQEELIFYEVLKHLRPDATMVELGGFWSYYSLWFLHEDPSNRRAIVVEPDPNNLDVGRDNARLNGRSIEFVQASVGAESIPEHIFRGEIAGPISIPQVTVPQLLEERGIASLEILHCDAQGAETDVLQSCKGLLKAGRIRFCIVSTHSHYISGDPLAHQRCLALLRDAGGQILAEYDVHESYSGDGLIAAHFGETALSWPAVKVSRNRYSNCLFRNPLFDLDEVFGRKQFAELEADRAARLDQIKILDKSLRESEADRAARLEQLQSLRKALSESEADRAARLEGIETLTRLLRESEADRAARLKGIETLTRLLRESEAALVQGHERVRALEARVNELEAKQRPTQNFLGSWRNR